MSAFSKLSSPSLTCFRLCMQNIKPLTSVNTVIDQGNSPQIRCYHNGFNNNSSRLLVNKLFLENTTMIILSPSYRTYAKKKQPPPSPPKKEDSKGTPPSPITCEKLVTKCGKTLPIPPGCEEIITPGKVCGDKKEPCTPPPSSGAPKGGGPNIMVIVGAVAAAAILGAIALMSMQGEKVDKTSLKPAFGDAGMFKQGLPVYTLDDVAKHNNPEDGIWFSWREGVYDITNFIPNHPGGPQIAKTFGSPVDAHFEFLRNHYHPDVLEVIESLRIGNLDPADSKKIASQRVDPYLDEPTRDSRINPITLTPWNATAPYDVLVESYFTPNELFYVRNHLPVPKLTEQNYQLEVSVEGTKTTKVLKLADIKKLPKHEITCALQCSGARRDDMRAVKPIFGLEMNRGAISNARWGGARLRDVLKLVGITEADEVKYKHVQAEGYDVDASGTPYGASIPFYKAIDLRQDTLIAYEMNGKPLPPDHGFPCRLLAPGIAGARSIKWIARLIVSPEESPLHFQQTDYKGFSPNTDFSNVDWASAPALQNLPVNSAICVPAADSKVTLQDGNIVVQGWAYSGGGEEIVRVDVTADGGETWHIANIDYIDKSATYPQHWGWALWSASIPLPGGTKSVELWSKAVNRSHNAQPESFKNIYNFRGVVNNAYSRVKVDIQ